jgi:hypothetical protein
MNKFERGIDPKEALSIGMLQGCKELAEANPEISILNEEETREHLLFENEKFWKYYPSIINGNETGFVASDFIRTNCVNKMAGCHIGIGTMNGMYHVLKKTPSLPENTPLKLDSSGTLEELYVILDELSRLGIQIKA